MITIKNLNFKNFKDNFTVKKPWDIIIIFIINILITIPIFLIIHQNIIDFEWIWYLDRILLFLLLIVAFQFILLALRKITLILVFGYLLILFLVQYRVYIVS